MLLRRQADAAAALEHAHRAEQAATIAKSLAILDWVDAARVDESKLFEGAERWVRGGADGTPNIAEFVVGGISAMLGISPESAFCRVASLLNLRHRHPSLFRLAVEGDVAMWEALSVADRAASAGLSAVACEVFDRLCATALRFQPWSRVRGQVDKWIIQADPQLAAERAEKAALCRKIEVGSIKDGHCDLWGRVDAADGVALDQALNHVADVLPDGDLGHRRAAALGMMARSALGQEPLALRGGLDASTPGHVRHADDQASVLGSAPTGASESVVEGRTRTPLRPERKAELVVHITAVDLVDPSAGVATVDRWGHLLADELPRFLTGCRVTVRPIVDAAAVTATDAYVVPPTMRFALGQRNPVDAFPFGSRRSAACDADHTVLFDAEAAPGHGQTNLGNLAPLSRFTHRLKTHGGWRLTQPSPGVLEWESPLGYRYLVTPEGSTCIGRPVPRGDEWWLREPPEPDAPPSSFPREELAPPGEPCPPDPGMREPLLPLQSPAA